LIKVPTDDVFNIAELIDVAFEAARAYEVPEEFFSPRRFIRNNSVR